MTTQNFELNLIKGIVKSADSSIGGKGIKKGYQQTVLDKIQADGADSITAQYCQQYASDLGTANGVIGFLNQFVSFIPVVGPQLQAAVTRNLPAFVDWLVPQWEDVCYQYVCENCAGTCLQPDQYNMDTIVTERDCDKVSPDPSCVSSPVGQCYVAPAASKTGGGGDGVGSNLLWLWILLGVLGGLALIGGLSWYFTKGKGKVKGKRRK